MVNDIGPRKPKSKKLFEDKSEASWLDDPEWKKLRKNINSRSKKDSEINDDAFDEGEDEKEKVELNIKLSIGKDNWQKIVNVFRILKTSIKRARSKINKKVSLIIILGIVMVFGGIFIYQTKIKDAKESKEVVNISPQSQADPVSHDPPFSIVKPPHEIPQEDIIYNPERKFVKFDDKINNNSITVNQQQFPENMKADKEAGLEQIAEDFGADSSIQIGSGVAYIKESVQGPQTVIFTKFDLLIFIKTGSKIDTSDLVDYIDSLN